MVSFKAVILPILLTLSSAMTLERQAAGELSAPVRDTRTSFLTATSACDKEDEEDCSEFCKLSGATVAKCVASGNKVTCSCRGGKSESKCEERCLLCMPDKSALEEASRLFTLGGGLRKEDL